MPRLHPETSTSITEMSGPADLQRLTSTSFSLLNTSVAEMLRILSLDMHVKITSAQRHAVIQLQD